jgi:hypothetical protein
VSLQLELQALAREVQRPFEQIATRFPLGAKDLADDSVGTSEIAALPQARVFLNGATNHTSTGNWQKVPMDSTTFDTGGGTAHFDNANDRLIARIAGTYIVTAGAGLAANGTGTRGIRITKGGTQIKQGDFRNPTTADSTIMSTSDIVVLAVGEYVELEAFQSSGGNLAYAVGTHFVNLAFSWQSP